MEIELRWFHWLCGLLEGEGTFAKGSPAKPRRPTVAVGMADQDVIEWVCDFWGTRLWTITLKVERYKPVYRTELVGGSAVALMQLLRPEMGERRQRQIDEAMATFQPLRAIRHKTYTLLPTGAQEQDRYWLAGLLEGEAYFGLNKTATLTSSPMVEVNSVDCDVIARVQQIWQGRYGFRVNIHTRPPRREGYQPQYHVACYGDAARAVMRDVAPLLEARACYDMRRAA